MTRGRSQEEGPRGDPNVDRSPLGWPLAHIAYLGGLASIQGINGVFPSLR